MIYDDLTPYELTEMSAWASSVFTAWLIANPTADIETRKRVFLDCIEGGDHLVRELRESR